MAKDYPLNWPKGWPRSERTKRAAFSEKTIAKAEAYLMHELKLLNCKNIVISSNILRSAQPQDRGVAVYFVKGGKEQCIPCDKWDRVEDNIWAITKTVEALRGIERWGAKEMVDAAFRGFTALPEYNPNTPKTRTAREILGITPEIEDLDYISFKYKQKAKELHPDAGGDAEEFKELQRAYDELKSELTPNFTGVER